MERTPVLATARTFVAMLSGSLGWRLAGSMALSVALALAEGTGLALLVPLLASLDLSVDDGPASRLAVLVERGFAMLGLQPSLTVVLVTFLCVSVAHAVIYRAHLLLNPSLEQRFSTALRVRLYSAIVGARWEFLVRRRLPELVHTVTSLVDRSSTAAYHLLTLLAGIAVTTVYVALAFRMSPALTLLVGLAGIGMLYTLRGRTRRSAESGDRYAEVDGRLFRMTSESLAGLKVAKSLGAEVRDVDIFARLADDRAAGYLTLLRSFAQAKMRLDITSAAIVCGLLFVAVEWLGLRGAGLLVLIFVFARVMPRAMAVQESLQLFVTGLAAFASVTRLIDECDIEQERAADNSTRRLPVKGVVRLDRVSFSYAGGTPVLRDVSLAIPHGRITAIVGSSGAGKSTLADLLLGLLQPQGGELVVDGRAIGEADAQVWRRSVGYVPQDGFLLHDTVRANLRWAKPDASDAEMWEALEQAAAASFLRERAEGLNLVLGDRGVKLSGGERQRVSLARALLTRPELLVLDEATSALDAVNEQQILSAVQALRDRVTIVIITHRLHAIQDADVIHVLDRGALVESGTWAELTETDGPFARLLAAQTEGAGQRTRAESAAAISGRATATQGQ